MATSTQAPPDTPASEEPPASERLTQFECNPVDNSYTQ